jgi:hypothetical protein
VKPEPRNSPNGLCVRSLPEKRPKRSPRSSEGKQLCFSQIRRGSAVLQDRLQGKSTSVTAT